MFGCHFWFWRGPTTVVSKDTCRALRACVHLHTQYPDMPTRPLMMMAVRIRLPALFLLLGNARVGDCLRVRIGLVEGYSADWKFFQKFAFAPGGRKANHG